MGVPFCRRASKLEARLQKGTPTIYEGLLKRWKAIGVSQEQGEAYQRSMIRISHLKNLLFDSNRITTQDAFDQFKQRKLQYQFEYVLFQDEDYLPELRKKGVSREELERFWKQDRAAAARYRLPATVSGAIVCFDPKNFTPEMVASLGDTSKVTRERALAYFKANQKQLIGSIPPDKRHLLTVKPGTPLDEIVTPFSLVKDQIVRKLVLEHLITDAHREALKAGPKADLKAIAEKYHLEYLAFKDMDRQKAMAEMREFGIPAFSRLFGSPPGRISPQVAVVGDRRFFFLVTGKKPARLPDLDEVIDQVRTFYFEARAAEMARKAARELFEEMNTKVQAIIEPDRLRLEKEAQEKAEEEIRRMNITREADKRRAHARARARTRLPLDQIKKKAMPAVFDEIVKRRKLKLVRTPWFEFSANREDRGSIRDEAQSRLEFLKTSYQVRSLNKGGVTTMILEDHLTKSFILGRLLDKKDPDMSVMGPVDLIQARGNVKNISQARFPRRFQFAELKEMFKFQPAN